MNHIGRHIAIFVLILLVIVFVKMSGLWNLVINNTSYEFDVRSNPSNTKFVTILSQIKNPLSVNYSIDTFLVPGKYNKRKKPEDQNFIKMGDGSTLDVQWLDDSTIKVYATRDPEINSFYLSGVSVNLLVSRSVFDEFQKQKK